MPSSFMYGPRSISHKIIPSIDVYAFQKEDGSQIRAEWFRGKGFSKFGTKRRLFDESDNIFGEAPSLIYNKYGEDLERILHKMREQRVTLFFEFFGENSFAGNHIDEPHDVVLFDVDIFKKGIIPPSQFLKTFDSVEIAELLYHGKIGPAIEEEIRSSQLPGIKFEGVVCKAIHRNQVRMFKVKTRAWLDRLRNYCAEDDNLFNQLK